MAAEMQMQQLNKKEKEKDNQHLLLDKAALFDKLETYKMSQQQEEAPDHDHSIDCQLVIENACSEAAKEDGFGIGIGTPRGQRDCKSKGIRLNEGSKEDLMKRPRRGGSRTKRHKRSDIQADMVQQILAASECEERNNISCPAQQVGGLD